MQNEREESKQYPMKKHNVKLRGVYPPPGAASPLSLQGPCTFALLDTKPFEALTLYLKSLN